MNRRGFLLGMLAAGVAPAIVKAANIMPVFARKEFGGLLVPSWPAEMCFTATDLTLSLGEFSRRYVQPAISALALNISSEMEREILGGLIRQGDRFSIEGVTWQRS